MPSQSRGATRAPHERTCPTRSHAITAAASALLLLALLPSCGSNGGTNPEDGGDSDAPSVTITQPAGGATVSGTVTVSATAERAAAVQFSVDGTLTVTDDSEPYAFEWDTTAETDGTHSVTATAQATARGIARATSQTITVTVDNDGEAVAVAVAPPLATVRIGETQTFTASVTGTADTGVTWSVTGGASNGTIDAAGLYTAPNAVPNPATVTVRATSTADPSVSGTASVTIVEEGLSTEEQTLANAAFGGGMSAAKLTLDAIDIASEAVFVATGITNDPNGTFTGTITEVSEGSYQYSSTPNDRLRVMLLGATVPIDLVYAAFDGFVDGTWEDFRDFHDNLAFRITVQNLLDLDVSSVSAARAPDDELPRRSITNYTRTIAGTVVDSGVTLTVNLTFVTQIEFDVSGSFAEYNVAKDATGSITAPGGSISVAESYLYKSVFGDNFVANWSLSNGSTLTIGTTTFAYQNVFVRGEHTNGVVSEPSFWVAQGSLLRDGEVIGQVRYSAPVLDGTVGPAPEILLGTGETVPLESIALD